MTSVYSNAWIGIDLGGTKVAAGIITDGELGKELRENIDQNLEDPQVVVEQMTGLVKEMFSPKVSGIGIGVPGLVDRRQGIAYDVLNIPNWKELPLKSIFEREFSVPVYVDNDANCFTMGEYRYGKFAGSTDFVGITLGTGMGSGIIKNGALLDDAHGCSGEFGTMPYLDGIYENYTSGMFFLKKHGMNGEEAAEKALSGDSRAIQAFREMGMHLGNAIKTIIMAVDPPLIIIGGSISRARQLFEDAMWESVSDIAFPSVLKSFRIEFSETEHISIKGAAALCQ
ncbi:MAG: ROK family protein [Bacteroidota bacterium]